MKPCFQSKSLHFTACALLLWKGISLLLLLPLIDSGISWMPEFLYSTGLSSLVFLVLAAAFSGSTTLGIAALVVAGIFFIAYWIAFALLAANRTHANGASVLLMILCALDLPLTFLYAMDYWWLIPVFLVFHIALFISLIMMRRSRPGVTVPLNEIPKDI